VGILLFSNKTWLDEMNTNQHRLIFCINSGRAGSNYLAKLLGTAREVISFHEAEPNMTGKYLHKLHRCSYEETLGDRKIKSEAIRKMLQDLPPGQVYCETNHMFIKTFYDVIIEDFEYVEVIILRRQLALVLKSFIELNYFTTKNEIWPDWMSSPNAQTAAIRCIGQDKELDQYDLCIAYLIDIEARSERFKREYPLVKTHDIRLEALNDYKHVVRLFNDLVITPTKKTKKITGRVVNVRDQRKREFNNKTQFNYCRERIDLYFTKAKSMGIQLPNILALEPYE
jgi:hypothetical protein